MPNRWRSEPKVTYKMERTRSRSSSGSSGASSSESGGGAGATPSAGGGHRGAGGAKSTGTKGTVGSTTSADGSVRKKQHAVGNASDSGDDSSGRDGSGGSTNSNKGGAESTGRTKARASSAGSSSSEDFTSPTPAKTDRKMSASRTSPKRAMGVDFGGKKEASGSNPSRGTSPRKQMVSRKSIGSGVQARTRPNDESMGRKSPGGKSLESAFLSASASASESGAAAASAVCNGSVGASSSDANNAAARSASAKRKRGGTPSLSAAATAASVQKSKSATEHTANNDDGDKAGVQLNAKRAKKSRKSLSCEDTSIPSSSDEGEGDGEGKSKRNNDREPYLDKKKPATNNYTVGNEGGGDADEGVIEIIDDDSSTSDGNDSDGVVKKMKTDRTNPPNNKQGPGVSSSATSLAIAAASNGAKKNPPEDTPAINTTEQRPESQSSSQSVTEYDIKEQPAGSTGMHASTFGGMEIDEEEEEKKDDAPGAEALPTTPARKTSTPYAPPAPSTSPSTDGSPIDFPMGIDEDGGAEEKANEEDQPINPEAVICWACNIPLQRKGAENEPSANAEDNDDNGWGDKAKTLGLYSIHAHPLLQISVCSSCADKAYGIEDEALQCVSARALGGSDDNEEDDAADATEMEACSLCALEATKEDDGPILLCCDACPRTFCARCVAVLNGGGVEGSKYVQEQEDDDAKWNCPACEAPDAMDRMQVAFVGWSDEGATVEADRQLTGCDKGGSDGGPSSPETKTTAALIDELNYAEDGLSEAAKKLEYDDIAKEREIVLAEVCNNRSDLLAEADIEKEVDAEMDGWISQWQDHHSRLSEAVTTLQDALEVRGIDLVAFYKDREANIQSDGKNDNVDDIPNYVKEAEAALDKRDEEEGFSQGEFRGSSGYKMDKNIANLDVEDLAQSDINEIEDINTLEGTLAQLEHISTRNTSKDRPCRWSKTDLSEGDIENMRRRALRRDDEELARLEIDIDKLEQMGTKEDADAAKERDARRKDTTRRTAGGVRINLLALSTVKKKKKTERQSAKKARKREREGASGPRYGDAFSGIRRNLNAGRDTVQPVRERLASDVSRREAKWAAKAAAQGGKPTKRRIAPQTIASAPSSSTNRNLFSAPSAFASLATIDRYGDVPTKNQAPTFPFEESNLSLPCGKKDDGSEISVTVAKPLAAILKRHQVEGVKFMWENTCSDLLSAAAGSEDSESTGQTKGAILAHNMGLGKSVQLCAYLHTFLAHPSIDNTKKKPSSSTIAGGATSWHGTSTDPSSPTSILRSLQSSAKRRALLCVPVNTIANWENEWSKWILTKEKGKQIPQVPMYNLNDYGPGGRIAVLIEWMREGGVLLTSDRILAGLCKPLMQPSEKKSSKSSKNKKAEPTSSETGTDNDTDAGSTTEASSKTNNLTEMNKELVKAALFEPGPDVVCLDEGHQMLKNNNTNTSKALHEMKGCPRRIVLTGTPIQNNLKEAYRMAKWTNPSCRLGTEADFQRNFADPIMDGMKKDATAQELFAHDNALKQLHVILDSFVQRRGADVLAKELPPMQQCVINIRQSKLQQKLYRQFGRYKRQPGVKNNFFDQYQKLRPVNNHPATLLIPGREDKKSGRPTSPVPESLQSLRAPTPSLQTSEDSATKGAKDNDLTPTKSNSSNSKASAEGENVVPEKKVDDGIIEIDEGLTDDDASVGASTSASSKQATAGALLSRKSSDLEEEKWWKPVHGKTGDDDFKDMREGGKIVLLLQILAHADLIGDKVVCFTQCLKTIDYIESCLNSPDWGKSIPAIESLGAADGRTWGQWRRNREYLRIDGATSASDRGDLVTSFNQAHDSSSSKTLENQAKLFLISKEAGGIGINLYAANRVILFDSHWNPSVDLQAIYRCYRYGQTKSVFAYRFLTEGTMEDKIYSRSVNKSGLAARVIDQKHPERAFTGSELSDILQTNTMVCCDHCDRWRIIPPWAEVKDGEFDGFWCCEMNKFDQPRAKCEAKERDQAWYHMYFQKELLRRQKKELAKLQRQEQREKLSLSQQSQDLLGSQSQEPTLYESEMRESVDVGRRVDPNKGRNTSRDVILRRLIYTAGGSKASHEGSKKGQKKHVTSWISKYHFHESLLKDDKQEAQNSKDAAAAVAADAAAKAIADAAANDQPAGIAASSAVAAPSANPPSSKKKAEDKKSKSTASSKQQITAQMEITNSPPPSPGTAASSKKKADNRSVAVKSEAWTASAKKRARNDPADESSKDKAASRSNNKKPRPADFVTRHENGHDVLVIIDSDEEEEAEEESKEEEDENEHGDEVVFDDGDNDYNGDNDEGADGVLV